MYHPLLPLTKWMLFTSVPLFQVLSDSLCPESIFLSALLHFSQKNQKIFRLCMQLITSVPGKWLRESHTVRMQHHGRSCVFHFWPSKMLQTSMISGYPLISGSRFLRNQTPKHKGRNWQAARATGILLCCQHLFHFVGNNSEKFMDGEWSPFWLYGDKLTLKL